MHAFKQKKNITILSILNAFPCNLSKLIFTQNISFMNVGEGEELTHLNIIKLNDFECNLFQMARKIISFDNNQMGHEKLFFTTFLGVKINLDRLHGKAFNMDNIKRFFFCLKACKLTTHLIITSY